jgi:hypothetical protein
MNRDHGARARLTKSQVTADAPNCEAVQASHQRGVCTAENAAASVEVPGLDGFAARA